MKKNKKMVRENQDLTDENVETVVTDSDTVVEDTQEVVQETNVEQPQNESDSQDKKAKKSKVEKNTVDKKKNAKNAKKTDKKTFGQKVKSVFGELKKVSWPSFGTVVKQTSVVIVIIALCTLVLFGVDSLFSLLYKLLTKGV